MIKQAKIPDTAKHMPFVAMLREGTLRDDWGLRQDAADRIVELEDCLLGAAKTLELVYGDMPKDRSPGPPTSIIAAMRLVANSNRN